MIAVIEVVMDIRTIDYQQLRELERTLSDGGSMYTATENGIEERVDPVAKQAAVAAMQPNDHASAELSEAWSKAYGRQQDASEFLGPCDQGRRGTSRPSRVSKSRDRTHRPGHWPTRPTW
jgi:hypothetical protein